MSAALRQTGQLYRGAGYLSKGTDNDQRTGHERWPGLIDTK